MVYRAAICGVVLFWVGMWTLLVRSELHPQETALRKVPLELVLKQLFQQGQLSDLNIVAGGTQVGHLRLAPKTNEATGERLLEIFGNAQVEAPGVLPQRAGWEAVLTLDEAFALRLARGSLTLRPHGPRTPAATYLEVTLDPPAQRGSYRLSFADEEPVEQTVTLDQAGLNAVLTRWGVDPTLIKTFAPASVRAAPEVSARQARLTVHGEEVETYRITIKNQGQTLLEADVSQLGQVLRATTLPGWNLSAE